MEPQPLFVRRPEDDLRPSLEFKAYAEFVAEEYGVVRAVNRYPYVSLTIGGRGVQLPRPLIELRDGLYALPRLATKQEAGGDTLGFDLAGWQLYDLHAGVVLPAVLEVQNPFGPGFTDYRRRYVMEMRIHRDRLRGNYAEAATAWGERVVDAHVAWEAAQRPADVPAIAGD